MLKVFSKVELKLIKSGRQSVIAEFSEVNQEWATVLAERVL